jgi:adenine deaminase
MGERMHASDAFIRGLPKAELHMHLEGSIEPETMLALAERNHLRLRWDTPEALRAAYDFADLQSFLDLYYDGCRVMAQAQDYYDVTLTYLRRAHEDGVLRAEFFVGPQNATQRGIPMAAVMEGVLAAVHDAEDQWSISAGLLIIAQRHRSEADAIALLDAAMPWADRIAGFGLGGAERDHPPNKFAAYFRRCRDRGFRITAHAGEEGPAAYVRDAAETIGVDRVDHGVACMDDPTLVQFLADRKVPLTVCPLSNVRLRVVDSLAAHPLRAMLAAGLNVSVNSDDPAYFGGYVNDNLLACRGALGLSAAEIATLARNSFAAAFMPPAGIQRCIALVDDWCARHVTVA